MIHIQERKETVNSETRGHELDARGGKLSSEWVRSFAANSDPRLLYYMCSYVPAGWYAIGILYHLLTDSADLLELGWCTVQYVSYFVGWFCHYDTVQYRNRTVLYLSPGAEQCAAEEATREG